MKHTFFRAGLGLPLPAKDGQTVAFDIPAGCVLTRNGVPVSDPSPVVHSGPRASYRIDCVTFTAQVTATLEIT